MPGEPELGNVIRRPVPGLNGRGSRQEIHEIIRQSTDLGIVSRFFHVKMDVQFRTQWKYHWWSGCHPARAEYGGSTNSAAPSRDASWEVPGRRMLGPKNGGVKFLEMGFVWVCLCLSCVVGGCVALALGVWVWSCCLGRLASSSRAGFLVFLKRVATPKPIPLARLPILTELFRL